jgi:hypothetical protein
MLSLFFEAVMAGIVAYFVSKWLDRFFGDD